MAGLLNRSDAIQRTTGAGADGARRLDSVTGAAHPVTAVSSLMLDGLPDGVSFQHTTFAPVHTDPRNAIDASDVHRACQPTIHTRGERAHSGSA